MVVVVGIVVQVDALVRGGVVSVSVAVGGGVSVVHGGSQVDGGSVVVQVSAMVADHGVLDGSVVQGDRVHGGRVDGDLVHGGSVGVDGAVSVVVVVVVDGVSLAGHLGLESVSVVLVVHHTTGAVGLHQGVVARDLVSVTVLGLLLDVSGVRVLHSVGELVLGGAMMLVVVGVLMVSQTVSAVQGRGQLVVGVAVVADDHVSRLVVLLQAEAVVSGEDACAGHGQDTQDGDESEGHCGCLVGWDGRK